MKPYSPETVADVCLILEGSAALGHGSESDSVRQIIEGMPELSFSILLLNDSEDELKVAVGQIPNNVVHLEGHCLPKMSDDPIVSQAQWFRNRLQSDAFNLTDQLHDDLRNGKSDDATVNGFAELISGDAPLTNDDLQRHRFAWDRIRKQYGQAPDELDLKEYFWAVCSMHKPLFALPGIVEKAPLANCYHCFSSGYAGFLGAMLKQKTGRPLLVSETGADSDEYELDQAKLQWVPEKFNPFLAENDEQSSYLRQAWVRFFVSLGRMTYAACDEIFTAEKANWSSQVHHGAEEAKLRVVLDSDFREIYRAHSSKPHRDSQSKRAS